MDPIEVVRSESIELRFEARRCIHSRGSVLGRPDVFVPNVSAAWLQPERATAAEIAELAHNCPSGTIRYGRPRSTSSGYGKMVRLRRHPCENWVPLRLNH
jgi:uncharacterized Fe-S cluster protein YjdI